MIWYNVIAVSVFSFLLGTGVYRGSWFFTSSAVIAVVLSAVSILQDAGKL